MQVLVYCHDSAPSYDSALWHCCHRDIYQITITKTSTITTHYKTSLPRLQSANPPYQTQWCIYLWLDNNYFLLSSICSSCQKFTLIIHKKDINIFHLTKVYKSYDHFPVFQTAAKSRCNPTAPVIGANVECDLSGCRTGQNGFHPISPGKKNQGLELHVF